MRRYNVIRVSVLDFLANLCSPFNITKDLLLIY